MTTRTLVLFASILVCWASPGLAVEFLHAPAHQTGLAPSEMALADMDGGRPDSSWERACAHYAQSGTAFTALSAVQLLMERFGDHR